MGTYSKLIVAALGVIALALQQFFNIGDGTTILGMDLEQLATIIISALTLFGVFQVKNAPAAGVAEVKVENLTAPAKKEVLKEAEATGAGLPDPPAKPTS